MTQEFHISVTPIRGDEYLVRVEDVEPGVPLAEEQLIWPVGDWLAQARQLMNDPLLGVLEGDRVNRLSTSPSGINSSGANQSVSSWASETDSCQPLLSFAQLGQALYSSLFQGTLRDSWMTAQGIAQHRGEVLRLRLGLKGSRLPRLPWEVLQGDGRSSASASSRPIATGTDVIFSRYQPGAGIIGARVASEVEPGQPVRVLMVIAAPTDQQQLELKREATHLQQELRHQSKALSQGMIGMLPDIQLTILEQPCREELAQALEQGQYHVLHYAGHSNLGAGGGILYLVNRETGLTETLDGDDLAGLLVNNGIRMAVFNSCRGAYTATADSVVTGDDRSLTQALVSRGIPSVLAMAEQIPDGVALTLTRLFYRNLKQGYPIDLSLSRARQGLLSAYGSNQLYWALPVLYLHPEFEGYLTSGDRTLDNPADALVRMPQLYSAPLPIVPYKSRESEQPGDDALPESYASDLPDELFSSADELDDGENFDDLVNNLEYGLSSDPEPEYGPDQNLEAHPQNGRSLSRQTSDDLYNRGDRHPEWLSPPPDSDPLTTQSEDIDSDSIDPNLSDLSNVSSLVRQLTDQPIDPHSAGLNPGPTSGFPSNLDSDSIKSLSLLIDDDLSLDLSSPETEADLDNLPHDFPSLLSSYSNHAASNYATGQRLNRASSSITPAHSPHVGGSNGVSSHADQNSYPVAHPSDYDDDSIQPTLPMDPSDVPDIDGSEPYHPVLSSENWLVPSDDLAEPQPSRTNRSPSNRGKIGLLLGAGGLAITLIVGYWAISNRHLVIPPDEQGLTDPSSELLPKNSNELAQYAITRFNQNDLSAGEQAVRTLLDQGSLAQARAALNAVSRDDIDKPELIFLRGRFVWQSIQQGSLDFSVDDARRYWEVATRGQPSSPAYANALGFALYEEGRFTDAIDVWRRSLSALDDQSLVRPSLPDVEASLDAADPPQLPANYDALTAYAGMALALAQLAENPNSPQPADVLLHQSIRLQQGVLASDPINFEVQALSTHWLWTPKALEAWQQLLTVEQR